LFHSFVDINRVIKYSIKKDEENSTDYFHIDEKEGTIHLKQSLDHETRPFHHIVLEATDSGLPSLSTTAHLWITGSIYIYYNYFAFGQMFFFYVVIYNYILVLDVNDNAPKFEQSTYSCWLSEDAERGQFVTMVTATDPDIVDHSRLVYDITGGNTQQMFSIDSKSGMN